MRQACSFLFLLPGLLCPGFLLPCGGAVAFDVLIRGGRVVDGTGNPAFFADVGLTNGRVAVLGRLGAEVGAAEVVDARGLVVAPGFIDVHTHAEEIDELPRGENFVRMGVTTLMLGNCGTSALDVGRFLARLEATNLSPNVATLIGHGTVRSQVMGGSFLRPPTEAELGRMCEHVDRAMRDGAFGLSTGLIYLPGTFARTEELVAVARVAGRHGGLYASHMRDEGLQIGEALEEVFRIAREGGLRAQVSHLKLSGNASWGQPDRVLAALERARAEGLDITQDQYLYTASSTGLSQLVPDRWREGGKFKERIADPVQKAELVAEMKERLRKNGRGDYAYAVIARYEQDATLNGLNVREAARKKRGSDSLEDQIELVLEIQANGGASGIFHGISEADLQAFLAHPNTMVASDSGVRKFGEGVPHPRGYGNAARLLARYVRELKVLRLEDAVRRLTSLPASVFHLRDRGVLREGAWADVVVFDPARVQDRATFAQPHQYATGFARVLVNGVAVVRDDVHTGALPGRALRHGR